MHYANCFICAYNSPIHHFRSFPCGHCFCKGCIEKMLHRGRASCPTCREHGTRDSIRRIYIDVVDSSDVVIQRLGDMDENSKLVSVKRTGDKLQREAMLADGDGAELLLKAVNDFQDRIVPAFTTIEKQAQEIANLRTEIQDQELQNNRLCKKLKDAETLIEEAHSLRQSLNQATEQTEKAITFAEMATNEMVELRDEKEQLERKCAELSEQHKLRCQQLEKHRVVANRQHKKIEALKQEVAKLTAANKLLLDKSLSNPQESNSEGHCCVSSQQSSSPFVQRKQSLHSSAPIESSAIQRDFEALPNPGFSSYKPPHNSRLTLKRKLADSEKFTSSDNSFPISLNANGRPQVPVQLGPKRSRRLNLT